MEKREEYKRRILAESSQRTVDAFAENAVIAADLKRKMLLRLKRIEEKYPLDATEVRTKSGNNTAIFRIRDLTAAYKDLIEDMQINEKPNELLQSLLELERRMGQ